MKKLDNDFEIKNSPELDTSVSKDDFKLVQADKRIEEQKFQTKPTTFFKDSMKRFAKNKSSVVATFILGILLILSIFVPILFQDKVHSVEGNPNLSALQPRLFDPKLGLGFWDGTKKIKDVPVDTSLDPEGIDKEANWWPAEYEKGAIVKGTKEFSKLTYIKKATKYGKGGFVKLGYYSTIEDLHSDLDYVSYATDSFVSKDSRFSLSYDHYLSVFDVYDAEKLSKTNEEEKSFPANYEEGEAALYLNYKIYDSDHPEIEQDDYEEIKILDYAKKFDVGLTESKVNINKIVEKEFNDKGMELTTEFYDAYFEVRVKNTHESKNTCILIKSIGFESNAPYAEELVAYGYEDGNKANIRTPLQQGYWTDYSPAIKDTYLAKGVLCSFRYDTYEALLGRIKEVVSKDKIEEYVRKGYMTFSYEKQLVGPSQYKIKPGTLKCDILSSKCPIVDPIKEEDVLLTPFGDLKEANCTIMKYQKELGLDEMPIFILGTDKSGRDMFVYVFKGLQTSLLIGLFSSAICFLFGLFWGSVSGYFGGNVDLVMERLTDILSGIPWIVCMTLVIINLGSTFFTFALAMCMTGWIGTAALTRTQFYRFRGREYVLASRTLGASHARMIAKHILPNAMGTIITSAVLMIPSAIFSEATISFLGLGFQNLPSLGVILSRNQPELTNNPYMLIFPAVIIALLMISFNLFGNGLRDAVNPSLKGEGE